VKFTEGAPGTSKACMNGTGVTLAFTNNGFEISSEDVSFVGGANASASGSSATAAPSASQSAKSRAGFVQVSAGIFAGVLCAAVALM
jgi:hypothetical protein